MAVSILGILLIAASLAANQSWLDSHFLPSFLVSRIWYVRVETAIRLAGGLAGVALLLTAKPLTARLKAIGVIRLFQVAGAIVLALLVSELVLQRVHLRPKEWREEMEEPHRQPDSRLGWIFTPARAASANNRGGEPIEYVFDARGYRVRDRKTQIDLAKPSNLFVGESVIFGDGLPYDASIPAQVEAMLGVQSINAGVYGYSTDQTYLRLEQELQRVRHPIAVIAPFITGLFGRNLDDDRPHLGPGLTWHAAVQHGRLVTLAGLLVPFRRTRTVEAGIVATRDVLHAIADRARSRGASPLIVIPTMGAEAEPERALRERIFDDPNIPTLLIQIDRDWHIPWDHHPDARAAHAIAVAVAARLRR